MERFKEERKNDPSQQIEVLLKILIRTDGYLNSANTKSTILLSLSSALFATILLNYDKFLQRLDEINDKYILSLFGLISLILLLLAIFYSLKGMIPYLEPSSQKNIYSFVDLRHYFKSASEYSVGLKEKNNHERIESLVSLNYNLSGALLEKYNYHKRSIECITVSLISLGLMVLVIILSEI